MQKQSILHPREYASWYGMLRRCFNPIDKDYPRYGGREILVCLRWLNFWTFLRDMGPRPEGHTLDRIDNDHHYLPTNCRWATQLVQDNNRSSNRNMELRGEVRSVSGWARKYNVPYTRVIDRVSAGWELEKALTSTPSKTKGDSVNTSKLTAPQVAAIRSERAAGSSLNVLAKKFGVSTTGISKICKREYWKHIP